MTALLVAMLQMVGGVSTIIPVNTAEFGWFFGTVLAGTVLFAAVQAVICGIVTVGDPDEVAWRQNYDALNFMMADSGIPHKSRLAVRTFFRRSRRLFKRRAYDGLIDNCLSPELKDGMRYMISENLFHSVWYLSSCEKPFLEALSRHVERFAYGPKELIESVHHLNVLTAGMGTRGARMIYAGMAFGDIILTSIALRDTTPTFTLIYSEAARISRTSLYECLAEYPRDAQAVREASIRLALNRAIVIIGLHAQAKANRMRGRGGSNQPSPNLQQLPPPPPPPPQQLPPRRRSSSIREQPQPSGVGGAPQVRARRLHVRFGWPRDALAEHERDRQRRGGEEDGAQAAGCSVEGGRRRG